MFIYCSFCGLWWVLLGLDYFYCFIFLKLCFVIRTPKQKYLRVKMRLLDSLHGSVTKNPALAGLKDKNDIGDTIAPAMTYFRGRLPYNYRQRSSVSRLCSEWEEVVPLCSNHRNNSVANIQMLIYHSPSRRAGLLKFLNFKRWRVRLQYQTTRSIIRFPINWDPIYMFQ